jgi:hypothetical protein
MISSLKGISRFSALAGIDRFFFLDDDDEPLKVAILLLVIIKVITLCIALVEQNFFSP